MGRRPGDLAGALDAAETTLRLPIARPFRWVDLVVQLGRGLCLQSERDHDPAGLERGIR